MGTCVPVRAQQAVGDAKLEDGEVMSFRGGGQNEARVAQRTKAREVRRERAGGSYSRVPQWMIVCGGNDEEDSQASNAPCSLRTSASIHVCGFPHHSVVGVRLARVV